MTRALVMGASGGIGAALAAALTTRGAEVTAVSRRDHGFDLGDPASVERVLGGLDGHFDLILLATGILAPKGARPEKSLAQIEAETMAQVMAVNAIGPALVLRHVPRLLARSAPGVVAVLTARVGSISDNRLGGWYAYRASKAAANQIVRTASVELARSHRQAALVALHPGTVETDFTRDYSGHAKVTPAHAAENLLSVIDQLGPEDTGRFLDWQGQEIPW